MDALGVETAGDSPGVAPRTVTPPNHARVSRWSQKAHQGTSAFTTTAPEPSTVREGPAHRPRRALVSRAVLHLCFRRDSQPAQTAICGSLHIHINSEPYTNRSRVRHLGAGWALLGALAGPGGPRSGGAHGNRGTPGMNGSWCRRQRCQQCKRILGSSGKATTFLSIFLLVTFCIRFRRLALVVGRPSGVLLLWLQEDKRISKQQPLLNAPFCSK